MPRSVFDYLQQRDRIRLQNAVPVHVKTEPGTNNDVQDKKPAMRLLDWLRRRRPQARTPPPRTGSSASPSEDYSATTVLHTAVVLNTLSATQHDAARSSPDAGPARTSEPPYGPHHTPHDSGGSSGGYDSGSSGSYDSGSTGSI